MTEAHSVYTHGVDCRLLLVDSDVIRQQNSADGRSSLSNDRFNIFLLYTMQFLAEKLYANAYSAYACGRP